MNSRASSKNCPSETIDHADHGVQRVQQTPFLRYDVAGKSNRGDIQAKLDNEGDYVPEVPVSDIERSKPEAETERSSERKQEEDGNAEHSPSGDEPVPRHEKAEDDEGDEKVHQADDHGAGGDHQPREIDLGQQVGVVDQGIAGLGKGVCKELPRQHGCVYHDGVGDAIGGELRQLAENDSEYYHGEKRPYDAPRDADDRLLIADQDILPRKEIKEFPVAPEVAPVIFDAPAGFYNEMEITLHSFLKSITPRYCMSYAFIIFFFPETAFMAFRVSTTILLCFAMKS